METPETPPPILGQKRHVCAFFNSFEEHYRVLRSFIKDGFDQGDKAFHVPRCRPRLEHLLETREPRVLVEPHPIVIIGGLMHENPFYVDPREFLHETQAS
ncbi:MAG TPA: hypothetical protein VE570_07165 [Thermoleophilaceae bacterium]|jgi:hypothetical protein|nr:hypothetical protein [Thermoleophilaceae bacterium]